MVARVLLTIPEVCLATHLGQSTIKSLIAKGAIESISIGRARRVPADAVDAWVRRELEVQAVERAG